MNIKEELIIAKKQYLNETKTVIEICKKLNVTEEWFRNYLNVEGISKYRNRKKRADWTKKDLSILCENYDKIHIQELCNLLNRPVISIRIKANSLGVYKTRHIIHKTQKMKEFSIMRYLDKNKKNIELYLTHYKECKTYNEMSNILNLSESGIRNLRKKSNLPNIEIINKDKYLLLFNKHLSTKNIAMHLNVSVIQLNRFISLNDLPKPKHSTSTLRHGTKWTIHHENKLKKLYKTYTVKQCAIRLGRSYESVKSKLKQKNIKK